MSGPYQSPAAGKETGDATFPGCCYQWSASVRTQRCVAYRHQACSFLMKANDGLRGSLFARQIGRESILGPTLCLCCGPNMICTCLLLCFLPRWAWAALSGGLCQHGDARTAVKSSIPAQNSSINKCFSRRDGASTLPQKQVEGDKINCKVFQSKALILHLVFPPPLFF